MFFCSKCNLFVFKLIFMRILPFLVLSFISFVSCSKKAKSVDFRTNYSDNEKEILQEATKIISNAYYASLITIDINGQPRARIVEPFPPENNFIIWMATNPKTRKVAQLKRNNTSTLHYFDKSKLAYVSLMGKTFLINDDTIKNKIWKKGWEKFYPDRKKDYLLLKFVPNTVELISISDGFTGDKKTWKPHIVVLQK